MHVRLPLGVRRAAAPQTVGVSVAAGRRKEESTWYGVVHNKRKQINMEYPVESSGKQ